MYHCRVLLQVSQPVLETLLELPCRFLLAFIHCVSSRFIHIRRAVKQHILENHEGKRLQSPLDSVVILIPENFHKQILEVRNMFLTFSSSVSTASAPCPGQETVVDLEGIIIVLMERDFSNHPNRL